MQQKEGSQKTAYPYMYGPSRGTFLECDMMRGCDKRWFTHNLTMNDKTLHGFYSKHLFWLYLCMG